MGQQEWTAWAAGGTGTEAGRKPDAAIVAHRFLQASGEENDTLARQLWSGLTAYPIGKNDSSIIRSAHQSGQITLG